MIGRKRDKPAQIVERNEPLHSAAQIKKHLLVFEINNRRTVGEKLRARTQIAQRASRGQDACSQYADQPTDDDGCAKLPSTQDVSRQAERNDAKSNLRNRCHVDNRRGHRQPWMPVDVTSVGEPVKAEHRVTFYEIRINQWQVERGDEVAQHGASRGKCEQQRRFGAHDLKIRHGPLDAVEPSYRQKQTDNCNDFQRAARGKREIAQRYPDRVNQNNGKHRQPFCQSLPVACHHVFGPFRKASLPNPS